jgi:outer membrane protein OmpA-like peptidoglycan-associated protein
MTVRSFGENKPLDRGVDPLANRRNRRVEIRVAPAGAPGGAP